MLDIKKHTMKNVIIIGTTNFSRLIYQLMHQENDANVLAFTTYRDFKDTDEFTGLPVVAFEDLETLYDMSSTYVLNTIGYSHMNAIREKVYNDCVEKGYKIYTYVSKNACVYSDIPENSGCIIMPGVFIGPYVSMGVSNIFVSNCIITHEIELGNFNFIGAGTVVSGDVKIENRCFTGSNSTIKNGIHLEDCTLLGSGSNLLTSVKRGGGICR